jgi:hypothetical protein
MEIPLHPYVHPELRQPCGATQRRVNLLRVGVAGVAVTEGPLFVQLTCKCVCAEGGRQQSQSTVMADVMKHRICTKFHFHLEKTVSETCKMLSKIIS